MVEQSEGSRLVVIGASAGGINALSQLVATLPQGFGAPVVVAQHLDPSCASHLQEILTRQSTLPVRSVTDHAVLKPGVIYVVPANRRVEITDHEVSLLEDGEGRPTPSIDRLLSSAAQVFGENLIAVILTGTGADGADGAREVKEAGGTVVIQNPETASFPGMPLSLAPTTVDIVADLPAIGPLLYDLLRGAYAPRVPEEDRRMRSLLDQLRAQSAMLADAEATIGLERQRYHDLFEFAPDTYLVTDLKGTISEANRAVSRLTGVPRRYVIGKPLVSFVEQGDANRFLLRLRSLAEATGDQAREWDVRLRGRTHGQPVIAAASVTVIRDAQRNATALRWLLRDVTETRSAEAQKRQEQARWQQQIRERTSELEAVVRMRDAALAEAETSLQAEQNARRRIAGTALARIQRGEQAEAVLADLIKTLMGS